MPISSPDSSSSTVKNEGASLSRWPRKNNARKLVMLIIACVQWGRRAFLAAWQRVRNSVRDLPRLSLRMLRLFRIMRQKLVMVMLFRRSARLALACRLHNYGYPCHKVMYIKIQSNHPPRAIMRQTYLYFPLQTPMRLDVPATPTMILFLNRKREIDSERYCLFGSSKMGL